MGNTLSFGIKLDGVTQAKGQLQDLLAVAQRMLKQRVLGGLSIPADQIRGIQSLQQSLRSRELQSSLNPFPLSPFINQTMGIGAGQNRPNRKAYQQFWQSMVPPQLVPPVIPKGVNWKQAGLGALVSPFSPWVGARQLNASGLFGQGGNGMFGAGGFGGFAAAFLGVKVATDGLRMAFEHLKSAVEDGAKLYQQSARTAVATGKLFQLQTIGQAIGLSAAQMENLIVRAEHPLKGGGALLNQKDIGQLFGAGRGVSQIGELQQIKNLSEYIQRTTKDTAFSTYQMSINAKPLQELHYQLVILSTEWKVLWADLATLTLPLVKVLVMDIVNILRLGGAYLQQYIKIGQFLHLIPQGEPGKNIIPTPRSAGGGSGSPWERMGFVIGGIASGDHARKTAENTKKIAENSAKTSDLLLKIFGARGGKQPLYNHP